MTTLPTRLALLDDLRNGLNERLDALYERRKDGSLSKAAQKEGLAYLVGAASAIHALGLEDHGITGLTFLASVRGVDDFLKG